MRLSSLISTAIAAHAALAAATDTNTTSSSSDALPPLPTRPPELTKPTHFAVIDGPAVTFEFSTPQPHPKNWIGIWHDYYGGPENNTWIQDQLTWAWAEGTHGSAQVDISDLPPGRYLAYFLGERSYKWLAQPVEVFISRADSMRFIPDDFTTHNGRVGDSFSADISGLLTNVKNGNITYAVIPPSNADWVSISSKGVIGGVPKHSGLSKFSIRATSADNNTAVLPVAVPVARRHKPLVRSIRVLTLNLWLGGRNVIDYHNKQVSFLASQDVDVVALQESYFHDGLRLAKALGWNAWQSKDVSILSRYPIGRVYREIEAGGTVRIDLDGSDRQLLVWNVHLNNAPYGPYDLCFTNYSTNYIQRREEWARRVQQVYEIVHRLKEYKVRKPEFQELPQILAGDFSSPSHLDYNKKTRDLHCKGREDPFPWPVSRRTVLDGKWTDSFREVYRNAWKVPGNTWSPIRKVNGDRPEPMDRIDFIYHKKLKTLHSDVVVVGDPKPEPYHADNEWTSDHAAVLSEFKLPK
ncbi:exonuclease III [Metarhizium acridum CQMa 102]|uniref:Exonuclease III n=2 Tax=Metarhizium acridum TaxID=92637 RepID=E9E780_METAQ|nr:exonuclease III [Metarhizium acridum CQMa 102]EFY88255.1 exonuclease III [Metarhizium acridum CQMa 102]